MFKELYLKNLFKQFKHVILLTIIFLGFMSVASSKQNNEIIMYYKPTCPFCKMAIHLLDQEGFKQEEIKIIDVSKDEKALKEMYKKYGKTVPQIIINGTHVGGCDDLMDLLDEGKFDSLLNAK